MDTKGISDDHPLDCNVLPNMRLLSKKKKKKSHQAHVQNFCVCFCLKIYLQAGEARFNYYMLTSFQVLLFQLKCLLNQNDKMIQDIFLGFW